MKKKFQQIKNNWPKFVRPALFVCMLIVLAGIFYQLGLSFRVEKEPAGGRSKDEIASIKAITDLKLQSEIYRKLILRVGPEQAQEDLYRSGLPFTGQTHLLNHVVGDFLYEKYGNKGLPYCRDYFLSSCYHGFILHAIAKGGMEEVARSYEECLKFGPTVSVQCAHAIGHGFLANAGYMNLTDALKECDQAIATMPNFPAFNCYDGVFMENIWAVHDDGSPSPDRWVKEKDPFYPCNDPRIDSKYLLGCWSNQPSLAYQLFKGDIKKVADDVCIKVKEGELQNMCFDGLARQINPLTEGNPEKTFSLCSLLPERKWQNFCVAINAGSTYSVGGRTTPYEICAGTSVLGKAECYYRLFSTMKSYMKEGENFDSLCSKVLEKDWREKCEEAY